MKSERRHDLETNELAEWIANLPKFLKDHSRLIIYLTIVVMAVAVSAYFSWYKKDAGTDKQKIKATMFVEQLFNSKNQIAQGRIQGASISDLMLLTANNLTAVANESEDDLVIAMALIKRSEALRAELHYRTVPIDQEAMKYQIDQAKQTYALAMVKAKDNPTLSAMAEYGLGLCEEEMGNFVAAEAIYNDIANNPDYKATTFAIQAQIRLDSMSDNTAPVIFLPPQEPPAQQQNLEQQIFLDELDPQEQENKTQLI